MLIPLYMKVVNDINKLLMFIGGLLISISGAMRALHYNIVLCYVLSITGWVLLHIAVEKR